MKNFKGFTLAEVLITLGVIGVVSAMTMPILIKNIQHKSLESQFKKSYSQLSQVIEQARIEDGNFSYSNYGEIRDFIKEKYKKIKIVDNFDTSYLESFKTYNKSKGGNMIRGNCFEYHKKGYLQFINSDGSFISMCAHDYHGVMISVDTNGYKGPNSFGHDLFFFVLKNSKLSYLSSINRDCTDNEECPDAGFIWVGAPCSINSNSSANGLSCLNYALTDTCPDNPNKKYWECLP